LDDRAEDIFSELRFAVFGARRQTATAMKATRLKQVLCDQFIARLSRDAFIEVFLRPPHRK
jgi:thermostable 8-oxoguanine DNA glycosylase